MKRCVEMERSRWYGGCEVAVVVVFLSFLLLRFVLVLCCNVIVGVAVLRWKCMCW